jgi:hypothetical protein
MKSAKAIVDLMSILFGTPDAMRAGRRLLFFEPIIELPTKAQAHNLFFGNTLQRSTGNT